MGDYIRWSPPYYEGAHESARSALFLSLNRNKRSIRLDLKNERGREALLRLVREYDVVLESFRPGVLDRLGVGYERMSEENPGIVYCAISGYGQDGPKRDASGHDMNYLGLIGLLGLTGERGGAPVQAAGQIADLGGGALMAAFGILAALRERDGARRSARRARRCAGPRLGRGPDRRRLDGRRRAVVAGDGRRDATSPTATSRAAAISRSPARWSATAPTSAPTAGSRSARSSRSSGRRWCRGRGPRGPDRARSSRRPGSSAHEQVAGDLQGRARATQWEAFAREHDCCLEPVLELDEALDSELVRAREMVVELDQPGAERPVRQLGMPVKLDRTPGEHDRLPGPALGEHTEQVLAEAGYSEQEIAELLRRAPPRAGGSRRDAARARR